MPPLWANSSVIETANVPPPLKKQRPPAQFFHDHHSVCTARHMQKAAVELREPLLQWGGFERDWIQMVNSPKDITIVGRRESVRRQKVWDSREVATQRRPSCQRLSEKQGTGERRQPPFHGVGKQHTAPAGNHLFGKHDT
jgi:hypothetical protein